MGISLIHSQMSSPFLSKTYPHKKSLFALPLTLFLASNVYRTLTWWMQKREWIARHCKPSWWSTGRTVGPLTAHCVQGLFSSLCSIVQVGVVFDLLWKYIAYFIHYHFDSLKYKNKIIFFHNILIMTSHFYESIIHRL